MTLRDELIQVAAVAVAIVIDLDEGSTAMREDLPRPVYAQPHQQVINDVTSERLGQEQKWGEQHHGIAEWLTILGEEYGEACRAAKDEVLWPGMREDS
jgi:hypothetical protein